ncbi:MAG: CPBP family intramembrane metalloprotease [Phycisphaerae bacterium]|nr:CPBP family intramembrane metalloprotease [Phycisphaerae bacterium]
MASLSGEVIDGEVKGGAVKKGEVMDAHGRTPRHTSRRFIVAFAVLSACWLANPSIADEASTASSSAAGTPAVASEPAVGVPWWLAGTGALVLAWWIVGRRWRLPAEVGPPAVIRPDAAMGLLAMMLVGGAVGVSLASPASGATDIEKTARAILGVVLGQAPVVVLVLVGWRSRVAASAPAGPRFVGSTGRRALPFAGAIVLGTVAMLLAYPVIATAAGAASWIESAMRGGAPEPIAHDSLRTLVESGGVSGSGWAVVMALLVLTGIPLCEEVAYRGLLQSGLVALLGSLRSGERPGSWASGSSSAIRWIAISLASLLFALMHLSALPEASRWSATITLALVGVLFGWVYERTGSIAAPFAAHAVFNGINLVLATRTIEG